MDTNTHDTTVPTSKPNNGDTDVAQVITTDNSECQKQTTLITDGVISPSAQQTPGNTDTAKTSPDVDDEKRRKRIEARKRVSTRGVSGITNFGATCYMNAALQALSATEAFLAYMVHPNSELLGHIEQKIIDDAFLKHEKENSVNGETTEMNITMSEIRDSAKETLVYKLRLMMKRLWSHNCEVKPRQLKRYIDKHLTFFKGGFVQHDSQEFLTALLDNIHETTKTQGILTVTFDDETEELDETFRVLESAFSAAKKEKDIETMRSMMDKMTQLYTENKQRYYQIYARRTWSSLLKTSYSVINDIFSGMSVTTIECNTCHKVYHKFERFDLLTLHLPEDIEEDKTQYNIHDLLSHYTQDEVIDNYNCMYCNEKKDATKKSSIYQAPMTLVILIKKYQKYNGNIIKTNIRVAYDHELDVTPYVVPEQPDTVEKPIKYELYSVIRHTGGYGGGHYYNYSKNLINGLWYLFDDDDVFNVDDDEPLRCNGYIMFFRLQQKPNTS